MRQFDIFVFDNTDEFHQWKPSIEDEALGWFHTKDWNGQLNQLEAEWIIFAHPSMNIDREFLNQLAQETENFSMVDAFAPRVRANQEFFSGLLIEGSKGFTPISPLEKMRYVAGPNPLIGVFSRRIIQRTGLFDTDLPESLRLLDYSLRMAHAGGRMFNVPYLVCPLAEDAPKKLKNVLDGTFLKDGEILSDLWALMYKNLSNETILKFSLRHPSQLTRYIRTPKDIEQKKEKATLLSKLSKKMLQDISC